MTILKTIALILALTKFSNQESSECPDGQVLCTGPTAQRCCPPDLNAQYEYNKFNELREEQYFYNVTSEKFISEGGQAFMDAIVSITIGSIVGLLFITLISCCFCPCCVIAQCMKRRRFAGTDHGPAGFDLNNSSQPRVVVMEGNVSPNISQNVTYNANVTS